MAVWDAFLTERDKQHMEVTGFGSRPRKGFGERPALLIIDDYYGVLGTKPEPILEAVKTWPMSCGEEGWEAIYRTQELLAAARANHIPVIFAKGTDGFPSPWGTRKKRKSSLTPEQEAIQFKIVDEIRPIEGELVVNKAAASAFYGTPLVAHLVFNNIDTVITCGETTSGCVRASVVDGRTNRFQMGVVEECTFDRTQASHAINLFDMNQKYADVIGLAEAIAYFDSVGESGTFDQA
jgi:nicotinamidase-related amidase